MVIGSLPNARRITSFGDVIKTLVIEKGMTFWDAVREYESTYGKPPDRIVSNALWEHDHIWQRR